VDAESPADLERLVAEAMAVLEQEQRFVTQVIDLDPLLVRERMRGRDGNWFRKSRSAYMPDATTGRMKSGLTRCSTSCPVPP